MRIHIIDTHSNTDPDLESLFEILTAAVSGHDAAITKSAAFEPDCGLYITNGDISKQARDTSAPIILYMTRNPYVDDVETYVYNKENSFAWLHTSPASLISRIWVSSQYESYKMYLEVLYKRPVEVVPFLYSPPVASSPVPAPVPSGDAPTKLNIFLYESNATFNESSLKSLYICQELYRRDPSCIDTVYFLNVPQNETASKIVEAQQLRKDGKLRTFKKQAPRDVLNFCKQGLGGRAVFLSNNPLQHITQFMYDIVFHGMILMHCQKDFPYGVYYDENDIETAVQLIVRPHAQNRAISAADIESRRTAAVRELRRAVLPDAVQEPVVNIHEVSYVTEAGDLARPLVITYDNRPGDNTAFYINTLKKNKWDYALIGKGEEWKGWPTRMSAYLNMLKTLPSEKVVVLTDARDVICCRSPHAFMDAFTSFSRDLVVCGELMCENRFDRPDDYIGTIQCHPIANYWKYHGISPRPKRKYVNNGLVVGRVWKLIELLKFGLDNAYTDDQYALGSYVNSHPQRVAVDTEMELFHTSCFGAFAGMMDVRLQKDDSPTLAELFGRSVFFLHIPGMTGIQGSRVVYTIVKSLVQIGVSDPMLRTGYQLKEPGWVPPADSRPAPLQQPPSPPQNKIVY
jgi:hypothetical protein